MNLDYLIITNENLILRCKITLAR